MVLAALFLVFSNAQATEYTGCLNNGGTIDKVAIGPEPVRPCTGPNQQQISWTDRTAELCDLYRELESWSMLGTLTIPDFCKLYAIGDDGPAGGIVFYITDGGLHGLEHATIGQGLTGLAAWGCSGKRIGTSTEIGTGAQNTAAILANSGCKTPGIAAEVADNFGTVLFDWFLPSKDELNQACAITSSLCDENFFSSSEADEGEDGKTHAWAASRPDPPNPTVEVEAPKDDTNFVVPVRAF